MGYLVACSCFSHSICSGGSSTGSQRGSVFWMAFSIVGVSGIGSQPWPVSQIMSRPALALMWHPAIAAELVHDVCKSRLAIVVLSAETSNSKKLPIAGGRTEAGLALDHRLTGR